MAKRRRSVTKKTGTVNATPVKTEPIKAEEAVTPAEEKAPVEVKAEPVKTSAAVSKVEVKAEKEAKAETKAEAEEAKTETKAEVEEVKADAKEAKAEEKKLEVKKPSVKKATAKKEIKVKAFVEYYGKQVEEKEMIARVKKAWTKTGKKVGDIKTIELYIKPEEAAVYYVINGTETGAVAF